MGGHITPGKQLLASILAAKAAHKFLKLAGGRMPAVALPSNSCRSKLAPAHSIRAPRGTYILQKDGSREVPCLLMNNLDGSRAPA
jgi:hypothetical protein